MQATVAALEAKRLAQGLARAEVALVLGLTGPAYSQFCLRSDRQARFTTCGSIARWLGMPAQTVLEWEGHWTRLSLLGKVLAPAMLARGLGLQDLAQASGTDASTVHRALWEGRVPPQRILVGWEQVLNLDNAELRQVAQQQVASRPKQPPMPIFRSPAKREAQRRTGDRLRRRLVTKLSDLQRQSVVRERAVPAMRQWWKTANVDQRSRWALGHLEVWPAGRFGLCWICGRLTYLSPRSVRAGVSGEHHGVCLHRWQAESPEYAEWFAEIRNNKRLAKTTSPPSPAKKAGRRLNSDDLAAYYATTVLFLRLVHRTWGQGRPPLVVVERRKKPEPLPERVLDLAERLGLARSRQAAKARLHERVDRLYELLPDLSVCDRQLRVKVALLTRFRPGSRSGI